jgi:Uma2 family endonuclease
MTPSQPTPAPPAPSESVGQSGNNQAWPGLDPEVIPDLSTLVTQDDTPVDNIYVEKQQRLLTEPLYSSWPGPGEGQPFLALANVGWFYGYRQPPLVPDMMLSLGVTTAAELRKKEGHSYYQWVMNKSPEVVIEIVSDRTGGEEGHQMNTYARWAALFYVIYDPEEQLKHGVLRAFVLQRGKYEPVDWKWFPEVGLGLTFWDGTFEGKQETWLRWCDRDGQVIPTGAERADEERRRADEERRRADEKIKRLEAQLRALGAEPEV